MPGRSKRFSRIMLVGALVGLALAFAAPSASASFHLMRIREVHAGPGNYVELQMYAPGQNLVAGQHIRTYDNGGALLSDFTFPTNVANSESQRTILVADSATVNGVSADFVDGTLQVPTGMGGGAVCYSSFDCVAFGTFGSIMGGNPSPFGTPALQGTGLSPGQALVRSIKPNCSTLLEAGDDTDNSAADFALGTPNPRNNSSPITEMPCVPGAGIGGDPNTTIKKRPKNRSVDNSPTFKFRSDEVNSTFKCKLDHKKFHKCKSPKTYHGLDPGKHTFKVEAIDSDGNVDPTPAKDKFKILP